MLCVYLAQMLGFAALPLLMYFTALHQVQKYDETSLCISSLIKALIALMRQAWKLQVPGQWAGWALPRSKPGRLSRMRRLQPDSTSSALS